MRTAEEHTAATAHPGWNTIVHDIEQRYQHMESVQEWCIRAVGAHLLGRHDHEMQVLQCLGESVTNWLTQTCAQHGITLHSVQHVRH